MRDEPVAASKPFHIPRELVREAYRRVRANRGAPGVDGESLDAFEANRERNLYKLWNRLSSGSYFPPPVRKVEIPKAGGRGVRVLGVPTVADRIAQTVVKLALEPVVEPVFHPDSYGYRPRRSALQAVGVCRERCWREDWVLDLDIRAFFDTLPHDLILKAVRHHTTERWIVLAIERWLVAPLQDETGRQVARDQGSPQGSAISPLLANLFMHYAFDAWMAKYHPGVRFERYCDDVVIHSRSEADATVLLTAITERLATCGLTVNEEKTRIVYCHDDRRSNRYQHEQFDFLGYTFRARQCRGGRGYFVGFNPAISDHARLALSRTIRGWRLHRRGSQTLAALARAINPIVRGWIAYYGRYFPSRLTPLLARLNVCLVRWVQRKYKRFTHHPHRAWRFLAGVATREPNLFVQWQMGVRPQG